MNYHTSCVFTVVFTVVVTVVFTASPLRVHCGLAHLVIRYFPNCITRGMVYQCTAEKIKTKIAPEQRLGARPRHAAGHAQGARSGGHARLLHRSWRARAPAHRPRKQARNGRAADPEWRRPATLCKGRESRTKDEVKNYTDISRSRNPPWISTDFSTHFFTHFLSPILSSPFSIMARLMHWPPTSPRRGRRAAALAGGQLHGARDKASAGEGCAGDASR